MAKVIDGLKSPIRRSQLKARCFSDAYLQSNVGKNQHERVVTATQKQVAEYFFIREAQEIKFNDEFDALENNLNIEQFRLSHK